MITLYTIGFTKKSAQKFFELLKKNGVKRIVDIRLNNTSQLSGFAKGNDLAYLTKQIANIDYVHILDFAPTKELLSDYQKTRIDWQGYVSVFQRLLEKREILKKYDVKSFDGSCFLCSEETPEHCHRRLLVEYFKDHYSEVAIVHLK